MAKKMSRRHMLGLTAATVGGVTAWAGGAHATPTGNPGFYRPAAGSQKTQYDRPYWATTYSGGTVNVKPLPPGLPGRDYKPVVVPTGQTRPFKIINGAKFFHLFAEGGGNYFTPVFPPSAGGIMAM